MTEKTSAGPQAAPEDDRVRPMRVYVAGAARDQERAQVAFAAVAMLELELAHDWVADIQAAGVADDALDDQERARYAQVDLRAVRSADVLWLLATESTIGRGAWVELGFALGLRAAGAKVPLVVVSGGGRRCIFTAPGLVDLELSDDMTAIDFLRAYGSRWKARRENQTWDDSTDPAIDTSPSGAPSRSSSG